MTAPQRSGQPDEAEAMYLLKCSYWESLTERQVRGLDPVPSFEEWAAAPVARPA